MVCRRGRPTPIRVHPYRGAGTAAPPGGLVGRRGIVLAAVAGLVVVGCTASPSGVSTVVTFLRALEHAGPLGWAGFVVLYGIITLTGLPASSVQLTAGFLLGPWWGLALNVVLTGLWGFVGFTLARTWLREHARRLLDRSPTLRALDDAVAERGTWMVLLLRLSPVSPYNVMTYALGATGVRTRDFVIGSMIGSVLPMTLYTVIGASVSDVAAVWRGDVQTPAWTRLVGLLVTVLATVIVTWRVRRRLVAAGIS